jgi:hypothetical protein
MNSYKAAVLLSISATLFACGGGGSETATTATAPVLPTPIASNLKKFWTFEVHEEPLAVHTGRDYPSFLYGVYAEDFNRDGYVDIVIGGPTWVIGDNGESDWSNRPFETEVLRGSAEGFTVDPAMLFGNDYRNEMIHLTDILASDFDGDGLTDLVFSGTGLDTIDSRGDKVYYYRNTGALPLVDASNDLDYDLRSFFHSSSIGDFNGDGFKDLTFWQSQHGGQVELTSSTGVVLNNNGAGDFVRDRAIVPEEFAPEYFRENQGGEWGISTVGAFDLNNSTCDDLVLGSLSVFNPSMILFNHCAGEFSKPALNRENVPSDTFVIPFVDRFERVLDVFEYPINDDEYTDIAILRTGDYYNDDYVGNYLQFLRNNGDQTFTDVTEDMIIQSNSTNTFDSAHVYDLDNDGYLDIVLTLGNIFDEDGESDFIWQGTASGLEQVKVDFEDVNGSLIVVDVNSDGDMDILVRRVFEFGRVNQRIEYRLLENMAN